MHPAPLVPRLPAPHKTYRGCLSAGERDRIDRGWGGGAYTCVSVCCAERGMARTHLPQYYCQSIIQGMPGTRLGTCSLHFNYRICPCLTASLCHCLPEIACVYLCMCLLASQLNAHSSCAWGGGEMCIFKLSNIPAMHILNTVLGLHIIDVKCFKTTLS